ncbi:MAG: Protein, probably involved in Fe2+ transport [Parcubacteria group bacterium GW2011_GWC2_42_12]|uniref:Protein, probably involved in Fe2+ transport n=1 Tax=Candidatus Falkowbacteria bacterium GW2011_GWA2_41_14 TaxID=1618635 RepID=A0A0G0UT38_9BACT|nr:MAG: Protein, probably involved in Fe2+ transport [Candidatus Falkowbacteria bacterium GW2011_GWA2_41_14]KKS34806.1 MAG: Protein, probably involved in Fe2+ transport [Parcubacteria group bacterium GW2011_GWC2_42_12]
MNKPLFLSKIKEGEEVEIVTINAGAQTTKRLADLGLTSGTKIKVLRKAISGPLEIRIRGSRLALGRGLANKITVKRYLVCATPN